MPEPEKIELELPEGEVDIREADVDDSIKNEVVVEEKVISKPKDELDEVLTQYKNVLIS